MPTSFQGGTGSWERVVAPAVQELAWAQNPVLRRRLDEAVTSEKGGLVAFLPWDDPARVHCFKRAMKFPQTLVNDAVQSPCSVLWWLSVFKYIKGIEMRLLPLTVINIGMPQCLYGLREPSRQHK